MVAREPISFIWLMCSLPNGINTIADFQVGTDKLVILGIAAINDFSKVNLTQQDADTLLKAGDKDLALLTGIQSGSLTASSFSFV